MNVQEKMVMWTAQDINRSSHDQSISSQISQGPSSRHQNSQELTQNQTPQNLQCDEQRLLLPKLESQGLKHGSDEYHAQKDAETVEEEMKELKILSNTTIYRQALQNSEAFRWLQAQLESRIALSTPFPSDIRQKVRSKIMNALPNRVIISKMDLSEVVKATYEVQIDLIGFMTIQKYGGDLRDALGKIITITGSEKMAQAETCGNYLAQVWPSTGKSLLLALKATFQGPQGDTFTGTCMR